MFFYFVVVCGYVGILNGFLQVVGSGVYMDNYGYIFFYWVCFNGMYLEYLELS